jgi:hypothetical protein
MLMDEIGSEERIEAPLFRKASVQVDADFSL